MGAGLLSLSGFFLPGVWGTSALAPCEEVISDTLDSIFHSGTWPGKLGHGLVYLHATTTWALGLGWLGQISFTADLHLQYLDCSGHKCLEQSGFLITLPAVLIWRILGLLPGSLEAWPGINVLGKSLCHRGSGIWVTVGRLCETPTWIPGSVWTLPGFHHL